MAFNDAEHHRHAETGPFIGAFCGEERIKDPLLGEIIHAVAGVANN